VSGSPSVIGQEEAKAIVDAVSTAVKNQWFVSI